MIDSVYSISAKYQSTKNVVERFAKHVNLTTKDQYLVSEFVRMFSDIDGKLLAVDVFENKQRTSTTNGILKAEAVKQFMSVLNQFNIETNKDFLNQKDNIQLVNEIKKIKGQKSGTTFDYVLMLSGDIGAFKKDRHIINFFKDYMHLEDLSEENLRNEFEKQVKMIKNIYPKLTVRSLDSAIWQFMSDKKN